MAAERILITVKTYPTLSRKYGETVCTAGVREDGRHFCFVEVIQEDTRGRGPAIHHHDVAQSSKVRWRAVKLPSRPDFQNAVRPEGGPHKTPPAGWSPE